MMMEFGARFYFPNGEKLKFFVTPELGVLFTKDQGKNFEAPAFFPVSFSFEIGTQYKLTNKFSALFKIKNNAQVIVGLFGGKTKIADFLLINCGIGYQF
jgi:hypothetical protein